MLRPLPAEPFDPTVPLQREGRPQGAHRRAWLALLGPRKRTQAGRWDVRLGGGTDHRPRSVARVIARHERSAHKGAEILVFDHHLEVLSRKPGALPGSIALEQARVSGGGFTAAHERFWQRARRRLGDRSRDAGAHRGAVACTATCPSPRCTQHSMRWSESARWTRRWSPSRRAASPTAAGRPGSWSGRRSGASAARHRALAGYDALLAGSTR